MLLLGPETHQNSTRLATLGAESMMQDQIQDQHPGSKSRFQLQDLNLGSKIKFRIKIQGKIRNVGLLRNIVARFLKKFLKD